MDKKFHLLEIYDADGYEGPNPLKVTGLYTVHGPENCDYYIVEPVAPVNGNSGTPIRQLALRTHYDADRIQRAVDSTCTVGITLARDGCSYAPDQRYGFSDFCFWKVGKIQPCNGSC